MIESVISGFDLQTIATQLVMICVSILIGTIIGAEREYKNKSAGLSTILDLELYYTSCAAGFLAASSLQLRNTYR